MTSIMTAPEPVAHAASDAPALNLSAVAFALAQMTPDLWEPGLLTGETPLEREARHMAALDIWDELLAEYADTAAEV